MTLTLPMVALALLIVVTGFIHIIVDHKKDYRMIYVFKPLTMGLIILSLWIFGSFNEIYHYLLLVGLLFSLLGDVFLMLKNRKFSAGLISFLIGHCFYIAAFSTQLAYEPSLNIYLIFVFSGMSVFFWLSNNLGQYLLPVAIYTAVISIMSIMAVSMYLEIPNTLTLAAAIGAILFQFSDSILAINKFKQPFKSAQPIILSSYYVAQMMITYSAFY
jgi:uncharacterized membrane protein YhhN